MTKNAPAKPFVMAGQIVWHYPHGKIERRAGRAAVVNELYTHTEKQVILSPLNGPYVILDNVWHISEKDDNEKVTESRLRESGLWCFIQEHHKLYAEEIKKIEEHRERQAAEAERLQQEAETKFNAVRAIKGGTPIEDVAKATGIPKAQLEVLVTSGI